MATGLADTIMNRRVAQTMAAHQEPLRRMVEEGLSGVVLAWKRRLEIQLLTLELSQQLRVDRGPDAAVDRAYDVFISYATEDGAEVARSLATELERRGLRVWIDQGELRIGDSLMDSIQRGLAHSRFGVVVISPAFLRRRWPRRELNALATIADSEDRKVILPIWHGVDRDALVDGGAVFLADLLAADSRIGVAAIADQIEREVRDPV
jgi:hypothetical protein